MGLTSFSIGLSITVTVLLIAIKVNAHPQCLDFRPPFAPTPPLAFCRHHSNFSCCTKDEDFQIFDNYRRILLTHRNRTEAGLCQGFLFHIKCTACNPYAAHVFDAEDDGISAPFPGLCPDFCRQFFPLCRNFMANLTSSPQLIRLARDDRVLRTNEFCNAVAIRDSTYCYSQVLRNPRLKTELVESFSSEEGCICLQEFARNLRNPLIFETVPDGSGNIIIGEQAGVLYVYDHNGTRLPGKFLDVSNRLVLSGYGGDERGFLGFTFHPQFAQNGKFYCYFSARSSNRSFQFSTILEEYTVDSRNRYRANLTSVRLLLEIGQPYSNHNGGALFFGQDGYLYLFTGDGGAGGDPGNRAQDRSSLLGKALRIDVNTITQSTPYRIPTDNPFTNNTSVRSEIYAYGLRNPWRCSQDKGDRITGHGRGRIFCGDVGQSAFEEVDIIERGKDYGWRRREGFQCYNPRNCGAPQPDEVLPIFTYNRQIGQSIIGGYVYRGCENPAINGAYILGDYGSGRLFKLEEDQSSTTGWKETEMRTCGPEVCFNGLTHRYETNILSFGTDSNGEHYILTTAGAVSSRPSGKVYKIVDPRRRGDPTQCQMPQRRPQPTRK